MRMTRQEAERLFRQRQAMSNIGNDFNRFLVEQGIEIVADIVNSSISMSIANSCSDSYSSSSSFDSSSCSSD